MRAGEHVEKELRRSRSSLRILGGGVILFTLWDILKPLLVMLLVSEETGETQGQQEALEALAVDKLSAIVLLVILLLILLLAVLLPALRIWIGRCALAEGLGKKKSGAYVRVAFVFAVGQFLAFTAAVLYLIIKRPAVQEDLLETVASLLVELTSMATMAEMALTARRVRRMERQLREAE